jgi:hypothetical protein
LRLFLAMTFFGFCHRFFCLYCPGPSSVNGV